MASNDSQVIIEELYPIIENKLKTNSRRLINCIAMFMNRRHQELHAVAPYTRILYNGRDSDELFRSLDLSEKEVENIIKKCFFYNIGYNPGCVKEPYVEVLMCCIKYFVREKQRKNAELVSIYLCFTGKFYASLHSLFWKYPPKQEIMDYVINNMLSEKFDLKREGTIFKSIGKLSATWLDTYDKKLNDPKSSDDGFGKLIQQLRDRLKSFLNNIATLYYEAVENKYYLNYETDSLDQENFRLTNNDSATAARITAAAVGVLTSQKIDIELCEQSLYKITTIKVPELCDIMEAILSNRNNIPEIRRVVNIIICDFMANSGYKSKVGGADFIAYSIKPKPNTKSSIIIEMKNTIISWLENHSVNYKRRSLKRPATGNDYYKAVLCYIVYTICKVSNR